MTVALPQDVAPAPPSFRQDGVVLILAGRIDTPTAADLWSPVMRAAKAAGAAGRIDLSGVAGVDTTGATLLLTAETAGPRLDGANDQVATVLDRVRAALAAPRP